MRRSILLGLAAPFALAAAPPAGTAANAEAESAVRAMEAAAGDMARAADEAAITTEAEAFMADYAEDLRRGNRAGIAARYDRRGAYMMGQGRKIFGTHAQMTAHYAGPRWTPPAAFEWRDLSYEPLGADAVAVVGQFVWTRAGEAPRTFSYTGLLVRQDGALRIRIEDEDPEPAPAPAR